MGGPAVRCAAGPLCVRGRSCANRPGDVRFPLPSSMTLRHTTLRARFQRDTSTAVRALREVYGAPWLQALFVHEFDRRRSAGAKPAVLAASRVPSVKLPPRQRPPRLKVHPCTFPFADSCSQFFATRMRAGSRSSAIRGARGQSWGSARGASAPAPAPLRDRAGFSSRDSAARSARPASRSPGTR